MTEQATQPSGKRRHRWWLAVVAVLSVLILVTVKWVAPIGMEQYAIATIRSDCPDVAIGLPVPPVPPTTAPPGSPGYIKPISSRRFSYSRYLGIYRSTQLDAEYAGPQFLRDWTDQKLLKIEKMRGEAEALLPAAGQLRWLRHVEQAEFDGVRDHNAVVIGQLKTLEQLKVRGEVSDKGIAQWGRLRELWRLRLRSPRVRGEGLAALREADRLSFLDLSHTPLENVALEHISQMEGLQTLLLIDTKITDDGLAPLARLKRLKKLCLLQTEITDAGLEHLIHIEELLDLDLSHTQVTLEGVRQLRDCPNLQRLRLGGFNLSVKQQQELEQALPGCQVTRY